MSHVYVFVEEGAVEDLRGYNEYAVFAESETNARLTVAVKYKLPELKLKLVAQFLDRRKEKDRRA